MRKCNSRCFCRCSKNVLSQQHQGRYGGSRGTHCTKPNILYIKRLPHMRIFEGRHPSFQRTRRYVGDAAPAGSLFILNSTGASLLFCRQAFSSFPGNAASFYSVCTDAATQKNRLKACFLYAKFRRILQNPFYFLSSLHQFACHKVLIRHLKRGADAIFLCRHIPKPRVIRGMPKDNGICIS